MYRKKAFGNIVQWGMLEPESSKVAVKWKILCSGECLNLRAIKWL
jgi:hypothetical protein